MPLDGTELEAFGNSPLAKLGAVERLLINEQQWCKGRLRDKDGRFCLAGAMQAVKARQLLDPIILRAIREVGGKRYWRIEAFNDLPSTTHADILRVLRRAREDVIAGMIEGNPRPWHERWLQTLRCLRSERWSTISVSPRFGTHLPGPNASAASFIGSQSDSSSPLREIREVAR
jgi:hypothetical protein